VEVSSTYWPLFWPSRSLIELILHVGKIDTPVRPSRDQGERIFSAPEADHPWKIETFRPARNERRQISGMASRAVTSEILDDFSSTKGLDHGLVNGSVAHEWWTIHPENSLSASGRTHWTYENSRTAWSMRTETYTSVVSDAEYFHLPARLKA